MSGSRLFMIGPGEVGRRLASALETVGWSVRMVSRTDGWDEALGLEDGPRVLAMREDDLPPALERLADVPRERLVLVQNGFLEPPLGGDLGPVTRGLVWFTSKGEHFHQLRPSVYHGPLAERLAADLERGGLQSEVPPDETSYLREMILKGVWNAVVGLPLAVHEVDLAEYRERHRGELVELLEESARAASAEYGVTVSGEEALQRFEETVEPLDWVRGGAKALDWRNGAIAGFGRRHGVPTPVNDRLLAAVGHALD